MRWRRLAVFLGTLVCMALVIYVGVVMVLDASDPICQTTCDRITERIEGGISEGEVQTMLSRSPDERGVSIMGEPVGPYRKWNGVHGWMIVWLNEEGGSVTHAFFHPHEPSFVERLQRLLPW
jgi:hypothetical protein